jgi:hypothetical protein
VNLTCPQNRLNISIQPFNATVTKGAWQCKYTTGKPHGKWKNAHIYENENGYLIQEIGFGEECEKINNVQCRKTNGTYKDVKNILFHILLPKWYLLHIITHYLWLYATMTR